MSTDKQKKKGVRNMKQEIHVYLTTTIQEYIKNDIFNSYSSTQEQLSKDTPILHTTQIHFLSFSYAEKLFVHNNGNVYEVKLGDNTPYTSKEIRLEHNLEKLLLANGFSFFESK